MIGGGNFNVDFAVIQLAQSILSTNRGHPRRSYSTTIEVRSEGIMTSTTVYRYIFLELESRPVPTGVLKAAPTILRCWETKARIEVPMHWLGPCSVEECVNKNAEQKEQKDTADPRNRSIATSADKRRYDWRILMTPAHITPHGLYVYLLAYGADLVRKCVPVVRPGIVFPSV